MQIAVFGTGGVGGYFGGLLAHAGHDVTFIARGAHLAAIREGGLRVLSVNGDFHVFPAKATDDPAEVRPVEYVIVAVKHYHLKEAAGQIRPLVGPGTTVVPLLNGVDAHEVLAARLGRAAVVGGLCSLVSFIEAPGIIRQPSKLRRVVVGELEGERSDRVEKLVRAWAACGADAVQADDIQVEMWTKFMFIASFGGITALARAGAGEIRAIPQTRALLEDAMREIEALAHARGVRLPTDVVGRSLELVDRFEPDATSSMQRDVAAGRLFELDAFSGTVVRLGQEAGVATPIHRALEALLRPALVRAAG